MAAPADRVQLTKWETAAGGGDAADESGFHEPLEPNEDAPEVQGFFLQPPKPSTARDALVYVTRDASGNMVFRDVVDGTERTISDFLTGGGGLTASSHRALDQLVHDVAENSYTEVEETAGKTTAVRTYTDSGKTEKIREEEYTYTAGKVTTIVTKQYAVGVLAETYTETVTYSGAKVSNITGVLS